MTSRLISELAALTLMLLHTLPYAAPNALRVSELVATLEEMTQDMGTAKFQEYLTQRGEFTEKTIDWKKVTDGLAASVSAKLTSRLDLVVNVVDIIEKYYSSFPTDPGQECCTLDLPDAFYNSGFKRNVDLDSMCYSKYKHSAHTVKHLGQQVTDQWKKNRNPVPSMRLQYFGSVDGFFYKYPASKGSSCTRYDPRIRPWYGAAAMAFRKVMILVVDTSTKMDSCRLGRVKCLDLIVDMLNIILGTLTSEDHVALVTFDTTYHLPEQIDGDNCYGKMLAIGSKTNKDTLLEYLRNTNYLINSRSKYSTGIEGALVYLKSTEQKERPVVVFVTGTINTELSTDYALTAASKLKAASSNPVLMTYYIGKASSDTKDILTKMSSAAGSGVFTEILQKGDIVKKLGVFYQALHVSSNAKPVITKPYFDFDGDGLTTTVCKAATVNGRLYGVVAVDLVVADLFPDLIFFSEGNSHVILIDSHGRTLSHPLLPSPHEVSGNVVDVDINAIEPIEEIQEKVFDKMKQGFEGEVTIYAPAITSKGSTSKEGIAVEYKNLTYHYRKVQNTEYSMCLVTEAGATSSAYTGVDVSEDDFTFTYHDVTLQNKDVEFCEHLSQKVVHSSVVKFSPKAFIDPFNYQFKKETSDDVKLLEEIFLGKRANSLLSEGVMEDVHLAHFLDGVWKADGETLASSYYGWRYIGIDSGVFMMYPGVKIVQAYDVTVRAWYQRALALKQKTIVSAPFLDALGLGYVISINQKVTQGTTEKVFGTVGMDLPVHSFYNKMIAQHPSCTDEYTICFYIDASGFIVAHPDWFNGKWKVTAPPYYEDIHIAKMEWDIALDMFTRGYLVSKHCANLYEAISLHYTEVVVDSANRQKANPYYDYQRIPDTNIYLVRKDIQRTKVGDPSICPCTDSCQYRDHDVTQCECACFNRLELDNKCTGQLHSTYHSCTTDTRVAVVFVGDQEELEGIEPCTPKSCKEETNEIDCHEYATCRWCVFDSNGKPTSPYCGDNDECFFGQISHPSPYAVKDTQDGGKGNHIMPSKQLIGLAVLLIGRNL